MTNALDTDPNVQAYLFNHRFKVGHELRAARGSALRIEAERHFEEVRLFLDPAGLIRDVDRMAEPIGSNLSLTAADFTGGDLRPIPAVQWGPRRRPGTLGKVGESLPGVTITIPAGTEISVSPTPPPDAEDQLRLRFPHETVVEVGGGRHRRGIQNVSPVLLGGMPLLEPGLDAASNIELELELGQTAILSLLGVVSPYRRRGESALYHVMEVLGNDVIGGVSIQVRV